MIAFIGGKNILSIKRIIIIFVVFIVGLYLFFLIFPLMLVGPPTSLFVIRNKDSISHEVIIEIFNEKNVSVFKKTFQIDNKQNVNLDRNIRWWLPFPSTFITWSEGMYTFNITVDHIYTKEISRDINQYETIDIEVFSMDYNKVLIPIRIRIITV